MAMPIPPHLTAAAMNITDPDLATAWNKIQTWGPYGYRPSLAGNLIFLMIWGQLSIFLTWFGIRSKMWWTLYTLAIGAVCETAGYGLRLYGHYHPHTIDPYIAQQVFLVLTPAFFAAAHFSILTKFARTYGAEYIKPLRPQWLLPGFVSIDLVSMVIQAIGSALAADAETSNKSAHEVNDEGNIVVVGLCIQLLGYGIFNGIFIAFAVRVWKDAKDPERRHLVAWLDKKMRFFLGIVWASSLLVFGRSIFRTIEMIVGWISVISTNEWYILVFDSALVTLAVVLFAIVSPTEYMASMSNSNAEEDVPFKERSLSPTYTQEVAAIA